MDEVQYVCRMFTALCEGTTVYCRTVDVRHHTAWAKYGCANHPCALWDAHPSALWDASYSSPPSVSVFLFLSFIYSFFYIFFSQKHTNALRGTRK